MTNGGRFETQYPLEARKTEIEQIFRFITRGQSCQLISVPGAGRSTVLRLLVYNEKIRVHHLSHLSFRVKRSEVEESHTPETDERDPSTRRFAPSVGMTEGYLFIYINFAEIPSFETGELNKAVFLAILASLRELGPNKEPATSIGKEIYAIFKEALSLGDPLVLFQSLKKAIGDLAIRDPTPILLLDRFSEFAEKTKPDFFANLRTLRVSAGGKLAVVFSTHRPLEDLLPPYHWKDFYEFFVGNHVWLAMYDKAATDFRIAVLEKEYGKPLPPKFKEELVRLTGGHGKLMKLSTQMLLSENALPVIPSDPELVEGESRNLTQQSQMNKIPPRVRRDVGLGRDDMMDFLLSHILIKGSLLEIWQALTRNEKNVLRQMVYGDEARIVDSKSLNGHRNPLTNYHLPFPLFSEFIRRNIAEQLVPKTIRFDEKTNEMYFGDEGVEGLTAQEFRLLKYLIGNPDRVCERNEIIEAVWSDSKTQAGVSDEALDQMVHRVRKKIEDEADNPKHLLTVKGRGFRFIP